MFKIKPLTLSFTAKILHSQLTNGKLMFMAKLTSTLLLSKQSISTSEIKFIYETFSLFNYLYAIK
ncbi:hypothetical protein OA86_14815 [Kaistella jeonii]|uniref:Uncharacterized protein n=1 Tax=Kaistella jeonii TaxID=266749 RepID=A0A0C1CUZ4_9FLAO|nr:hypothetical protein OA86_14815 [Kaistella jeonii]